ncbi:MAG: hypothetical protein KF688_17865 [Pirellulales bacterium]|nr:hypothetical protein [Pirellulales bacterium]
MTEPDEPPPDLDAPLARVRLSRAELVELVRLVQRLLYLDDDGRRCWNADKAWDAADVCDELAAWLDRRGLAPPRAAD